MINIAYYFQYTQLKVMCVYNIYTVMIFYPHYFTFSEEEVEHNYTL